MPMDLFPPRKDVARFRVAIASIRYDNASPGHTTPHRMSHAAPSFHASLVFLDCTSLPVRDSHSPIGTRRRA